MASTAAMIRTSLSLRPLASSAVTANQIRRSLAWAATTQRQPLAFFQLVRASASTNCSSWRRWSHNQVRRDPLKGPDHSIQEGLAFQASGTEQEPEHEFVPEEHDDPEKTIYRGILSAQIKLVKSFSLMTSVIGLGCQPLIYLKVSAAGSASLPFVVAGGAFLSFFTFATPLLIHWVSKKYVTEMLYNRIENTYTAVTYSFLLRKKEVSKYLTSKDVCVCLNLFVFYVLLCSCNHFRTFLQKLSFIVSFKITGKPRHFF